LTYDALVLRVLFQRLQRFELAELDVLDEALVILGDLPALWTSLDDNGKQAWVQVLFQKLVINDRGKVVDRVLNHPFDEILEFKRGRSISVRLSSP
jgi:hypothetical protein